MLRGPQSALERARPYLLTFFLPIVILAVGSLVVEYGFHIEQYGLEVLHWIEVVALGGLLLDPLVRLALARDPVAMMRFRWFELAIAAAFLIFLGAVWLVGPSNGGAWALRAVQLTIVLFLLSRLVELQQFVAALRVRPALLLVGSFLTLIAIGTGLLLLPAATARGQPPTTFTVALFSATSAVCVTGLAIVDTGAHWTLFGQYVILVLIQLGGLGLMTFASVMALLMWRGMRVRETMVIREAFAGDLRAEVRRVTIFILLTAFLIEAAGAALMLGLWQHAPGGGPPTTGERVYYSVFHSVSAFCNAGFGLFSRNLMDFRSTWQANLVIPLLVISGGIGFGVLYNLARVVRYRLIQRRAEVPLVKKRLSLQSKLALVTTAALLAAGVALVLVFEVFPGEQEVWHSTTYMPVRTATGEAIAPPSAAPTAESPLGESWADRLLGAWFISVTARTAGFNTVAMTHLAFPTKFITIVLMFVGASPGSTGGGIKTVTFAVILCGVWATLRGRPRAQVFRRTLPPESVLRAMGILTVCVAWVSGIAMVVCAWGMAPGAQFTFLDVLFETTSGFGTVGLSTGATPLLNDLGRVLIAITMFFGRVGPVTLFMAMQGTTPVQRYTYASEDVQIG
jgi:trk system potassium uptake protein TrkH